MRTEQIICNKLLDMMEDTPYNKIKVSDFVKYAGISRSSFYFYFESIEDVVNQMEDDIISALPDASMTAANLANKTTDDPNSFIKICNARMQKKLRMFRILSSSNGRSGFQRKFYERIKQINIIYYGKSTTSDLYIEFLAEYYAGAQWGMYCWWSRHENEISLDDINQYIEKLPKGLTDLPLQKK